MDWAAVAWALGAPVVRNAPWTACRALVAVLGTAAHRRLGMAVHLRAVVLAAGARYPGIMEAGLSEETKAAEVQAAAAAPDVVAAPSAEARAVKGAFAATTDQ